MSESDEVIDFAVAAYRQAGEWRVADLTLEHLADVDTLSDALLRLPGDDGAVAMVAVDEDFFVIVRVSDSLTGPHTRVLLSDATAAEDFQLADSALDFLGVEDLDQLLDGIEVDDDAPVPAGDLDLLGDLGMPGQEMQELLEDDDLYPDEMLSDVARQLGFGEQFDDVVGLSPA